MPPKRRAKESYRQKSKLRARIERVFGQMSQLMKQLYPPRLGWWCKAAAIGLADPVYNLARYQPIVRLKLLSQTAA